MARSSLHDWSSDNQYLIYSANSAIGATDSPAAGPGRNDLWVLPLAGNANPIPFQRTRANETYAQFSPDVKWIAFRLGRKLVASDVYVAPFPGPGKEPAGSQEPREPTALAQRWEGTLLSLTGWATDGRRCENS